MKKIYFYVAIGLILSGTSCMNMGEKVSGNGNMSSIIRAREKTEKIRVVGGIDVFLVKGAPSVKVEADENLLQYIETNNDGDWLVIKTKDNVSISSSDPIKVYVTTQNIHNIEVTGSGNVTGDTRYTSDDDMSFRITGSGDIKVDVKAPKVSTAITGSGNLHISGETKDAVVDITGSGNYDGPDLKAENAAITLAGSGDANVYADDKLKASIMGSGEVKYKGNPTVDTHIAGSGAVSKM